MSHHIYFLQYSIFFPKDLRFEHGGAKLASWPGHHLTSLCIFRFWLTSSCLYCSSTDWPILSYSVRRTRSPSNGIRGVTRGHNYPFAESLRGRQMTAGGAGKSQQCHMYILQHSKFASERYLVTPLYGTRAFLSCHNVWPSSYVTIPEFGHNFNFFQAIFAPPSKWRPWHVPCLLYLRYATANIWS